MIRLLRRFRKDEKGTSALEFALLAQVFFLFIFVLIDFGRLYWVVSSMEYAVEGGGRYAMLNISATSAQVIAQAQSNLYVITPATVTFTTSTSTVSGINYMTIKAQSTYNFIPDRLFPITSIALSKQVTVPLLP